jgi:hypothetical protein
MAGSEDLVLKISADTTAVASGLAPMTDALDKIKTGADATNDQLTKLSGVRVAPTVDDSGLKSAAESMTKLDAKATETSETLADLSRDKVSPAVDVSNVDKLTDAVKESATGLKGLEAPVQLSVRDQAVERAKERIEELKDEIAENVEMGVDTKDALREMSTLERSVKELTDEPQTVDMDVQVDQADADFAFENMNKLKKGVKGLTEALLSVGDGVGAIPGLVSASLGSLGALNATMVSVQEQQAAAGAETSAFTDKLGDLTGFLTGPWALPIAAGVTLLGAFASNTSKAADETKKMSEAVDYQSGALDRNNRVKAAQMLLDQRSFRGDFVDIAHNIGVEINDMTGALLLQAGSLDKVNAAFDKHEAQLRAAGDAQSIYAADVVKGQKQQFDALVATNTASAESQRHINEALNAYTPAADAAASATGSLASSVDGVSISTQNLSSHESTWVSFTARINETRTEMDKLIDSVDLFNGRFATAQEATAQYQEDLDNLTVAIKENGRTTRDHGKTLDLSSAKGRANQEVLIKTAEDIETLRKARLKDMETSGESSKKIEGDYEKQRAALYKTAHQMGLSEAAAKKYVDSLLAPKSVDTQVNLKGVDKADAEMEKLTKDRQATVNVKLNIDKWSEQEARRRAQNIAAGNLSASGTSAAVPPAPSPRGASTVLLQPRIFLDSRPIRAVLRSDVETAVADTYASQTVARRAR